MLLLAGSLAADYIYVHVTNTCSVDLDVYESGVLQRHWEFEGDPVDPVCREFDPIPGYTYTVIAEGIRYVGSFYYTDSDSGYLSLTHPDILHLYLDVSGEKHELPAQD